MGYREAVPDGEGGEFVGGFGEAGFHVDDEQEGTLFALEGSVLLGENFLHFGITFSEFYKTLLLIHEIGRANKE